MYKMLKPPKERKVIYLRVVSTPVWYGGGKPLKASIPELKVGSITWTYRFNGPVTILEENQFSVNFDSRCFEEVEYRFKTKEEFLAEGLWSYEEGAPSLWNRQMNKYLGKPIPSEYYEHCNKSSDFIYEGGYFTNKEYTDKPLKETTLGTKEDYPLTTKEALKSKYRFKTEEEFKRDGLWSASGVPLYWNSSGQMNHYMGKPIDSVYDIRCDNKERIVICGWEFRPEDYVLNTVFTLKEESTVLKPHEIVNTVTSTSDIPEHSDLLSTDKAVLDENPFKKVDEFIQREKDEKQKTSVENDFTQMININI